MKMNTDIALNIPDNEHKAIRDLKIALKQISGFSDLIIFGSKVTGKYTDESDIDVAIVFSNISDDIISTIDDIIFEINLKYDCLVSAIYYDQQEIQFGPTIDSPLYKKILQEGIPV